MQFKKKQKQSGKSEPNYESWVVNYIKNVIKKKTASLVTIPTLSLAFSEILLLNNKNGMNIYIEFFE